MVLDWRLDGTERSGPARSHAIPATAFALLAVLVLAGCLSSGPIDRGVETTTPTPTVTSEDTDGLRTNATAERPDPASLDSTLYGLTTTENATAYADRNDLRLRGDCVQVTVTLADGATLPSSVDVAETARSGDRVEGYVAIDRLRALAAHGNVTTVAAPERPQLHDGAASVTRTPSSTTEEGRVVTQNRCSRA